MMLPAAIIGLAGLVAVKKKDKVIPPHIQAQRQSIYESMLKCHDPVLLRKVSQAFLAEGYKPEGTMLELRARLAEAPPEVKKMRRAALQKGLSSRKPAGVRNLAAAFEAIGATGSAGRLRQYAKGLEDAGITGNEPDPEPEPATDQAAATQPEQQETR